MNKQSIEYYQSISSAIEDYCKPLKEYLGISLFIYFKVYHKDSSYIMLTNDIEATKEYCTKVNSDVIYFQSHLKTNTKSELIFWPEKPINLGMQVFYDKGYWHGLAVTKREIDSTETVCFVSERSNHRISEFFIKHSRLLEKFTEHFKISFADILCKAMQCRAVYKDGFDFFFPKNDHLPNYDLHAFLKYTGIDKNININGKIIHITDKEKQCLELMGQGYSIKTIARKLLLSPRTVETHMNHIKHKTGLYFKHDLLNIFGQLNEDHNKD